MSRTLAGWRAGAAFGALAALDAATDREAGAAALVDDARWAAAMLEPLMRVLAAEPAALAALAGQRAGRRATLMLHRGAGAALSLSLADREAAPPRHAEAGGRLSFVRVLAGEGRATRWEAGTAGAGFSAAAAPPLGPPEFERVRAGAVLRLDGRRAAWRIDAGAAPLVLLTLTVADGAAALVRDYALPSGTLARVAAAQGAGARAAMLVALIDTLDAEDADDALAAASGHADFFVRWAAMRTWLARDVPRALARLRAMAAGDPHPEIRGAATATLALLAAPCRA